MPAKTTKKTTKAAAAVKKPVAKKTTAPKTKTTTRAPKAPSMVAACQEHLHECKCGANCKCHGHKFGRVIKKLIIALVLLALGFAAAKICCCDKNMRGPRVVFAENGCMVEETVKCQKMREMLPAMDIDQDGCITRNEHREFKHQLRMRKQAQNVEAEPVEESVDTMIE